MNPGIMMLPVMARDKGSRRSSSRHSSAERPSFQRMAGRSGRSCASSSVAPCIWPERPTARTLARAAPERPLTARTVACHQPSGSCSENPGAGRLTSSGAAAEAATVPCSVRSTALTLEVPMSMPRYRRGAPVGECPGAMVAVSDRGCQLGPPAWPRSCESRPVIRFRGAEHGPMRRALPHPPDGPLSSPRRRWDCPCRRPQRPSPSSLRPRTAGATLLRWLYDEIRLAIVEGRLPAGARLPSTRGIARQYRVARGTVVAAFDHLIAEGYIEGSVGSGSFVRRMTALSAATGAAATRLRQRPTVAAPALSPPAAGAWRATRSRFPGRATTRTSSPSSPTWRRRGIPDPDLEPDHRALPAPGGLRPPPAPRSGLRPAGAARGDRGPGGADARREMHRRAGRDHRWNPTIARPDRPAGPRRRG